MYTHIHTFIYGWQSHARFRHTFLQTEKIKPYFTKNDSISLWTVYNHDAHTMHSIHTASIWLYICYFFFHFVFVLLVKGQSVILCKACRILNDYINNVSGSFLSLLLLHFLCLCVALRSPCYNFVYMWQSWKLINVFKSVDHGTFH